MNGRIIVDVNTKVKLKQIKTMHFLWGNNCRFNTMMTLDLNVDLNADKNVDLKGEIGANLDQI